MADTTFWFHPDAKLEALSAHDRYCEASESVGEAFQLELERARDAIARDPRIWASYLHGTQRYLMRRFPYVVVFRSTNDRIEIIAIAHGQQRPGYWASRVVR